MCVCVQPNIKDLIILIIYILSRSFIIVQAIHFCLILNLSLTELNHVYFKEKLPLLPN